LKMGLAAKGTEGGPKMKSSNYGVFRRGADGHQEGPEDT